MNMKEKGKTPLEQRQERIQRLRVLVESNKDKSSEQIRGLLLGTLLNEGLTLRKCREYIELVVRE